MASWFPAELGHLHGFSSFNPSCYQLLGNSRAQSPSWQNLPLNSTKRTKSSRRVTAAQAGSPGWGGGGAGDRPGGRHVRAGDNAWSGGWWPARDQPGLPASDCVSLSSAFDIWEFRSLLVAGDSWAETTPGRLGGGLARSSPFLRARAVSGHLWAPQTFRSPCSLLAAFPWCHLATVATHLLALLRWVVAVIYSPQ